MNELEKMVAGKLYDPTDELLTTLRIKAHRLCQQFNNTYDTDYAVRADILKELLPNLGEGSYIQGPIQFDYGVNTSFGCNCYANFNLTVLDTCPINIGDDVFFGPNCALVTPLHPFVYEERKMRRRENGEAYDLEYGKPITIDDGCWIASNVTVCGGVHIGRGCIIGAGSVVTRDIPDNSIAAGNPCRVIRQITEDDRLSNHPELF